MSFIHRALLAIGYWLYPSSRASRSEGLEAVFSVDESAPIRARRGASPKECLEGLSRRCNEVVAESGRIRQERDRFKTLQGQTIAEVLVAIAVGVILVGAAASLILPSLKGNTQATDVQQGSTLANGLLENVRVFSEGSWDDLLALATGSANTYFLETARSPFAAATGTEAIPYDGITSGLVGWWKFDEGYGSSTIDSSGNGNVGTWYGAAAGTGGTYYAAGRIGQYAGDFNGTNDYVNVGDSASLNIAGSITMVAWVKTAMTTEGYILNKFDNNAEAGGYAIEVGRQAPGIFGYAVGGGAGPYFYSSGKTINDGNWHQVAVTHAGNVIAFYVDGALATTTSYSAPASWAGALGVGYSPAVSGIYFSGLIDDARIYNRALSSGEITQIYSDTYKRYFYLNDAYRNGSGLIASGGSAYDPSTKQVVVGYAWPGGATQTLSTFLTRNENFVLDQTDWSGGSAPSGTVETTTNSQFATSSNIDYTTTTGSFYLAIPGY